MENNIPQPKSDFDKRQEVVTFLENDITDRLFKIYNSKFWIGALQDLEEYKDGVKAVKQLNELIKGLMALKASCPVDQGLFDSTPDFKTKLTKEVNKAFAGGNITVTVD